MVNALGVDMLNPTEYADVAKRTKASLQDVFQNFMLNQKCSVLRACTMYNSFLRKRLFGTTVRRTTFMGSNPIICTNPKDFTSLMGVVSSLFISTNPTWKVRGCYTMPLGTSRMHSVRFSGCMWYNNITQK